MRRVYGCKGYGCKVCLAWVCWGLGERVIGVWLKQERQKGFVFQVLRVWGIELGRGLGRFA